jgi:uncharacterized protein YecT (DUF1311 family)
MKMRNLTILMSLFIALGCTQMDPTNPSINDTHIVYDTICIYDTIEVTKVIEVATEPEPEFYIVWGDTIAAEDMGQQDMNKYSSEITELKEKEAEELYLALVKKYKGYIREADGDEDYINYAQEELRMLRDSQKQWLQYVEADFQFVGAQFEGGTIRCLMMCEHKTSLIENRINDLRYWLNDY